MKKGDVIRQKCVNTTFYLTGILAHKVNNLSNGDLYHLRLRTSVLTVKNFSKLIRLYANI